MTAERRLWINRSSKHDNACCFVIDVDEVEAINVPDVTKPGMVVMLKSGQVIDMTGADGKYREEMIQFFVDMATNRLKENVKT